MENNEQKTNASEKTAETNANLNDGNQSESMSLIDRANFERQKLEKTLAELRAENSRRERIIGEEKLSGVTGGRIESHVETADEKWAREAKIRYAGTGICPA